MNQAKFKIGDKPKYEGNQAVILDVFKSGGVWRYEVEIKRGANKGLWCLTERELK